VCKIPRSNRNLKYNAMGADGGGEDKSKVSHREVGGLDLEKCEWYKDWQ